MGTQTEREIQRDRQTDRQTETETERGRETDRDRETETETDYVLPDFISTVYY